MLRRGRDDAALVGAVGADDVEGGGGAEVDDDERAAMGAVRGERVDQAVRADVLAVVHAHLDADVDLGVADHHRRDLDELVVERGEVVGATSEATSGGEECASTYSSRGPPDR